MGLLKICSTISTACAWLTIVPMVEVWSTYAVCHTLMQLPRCLQTCVSLASGRIARASTRAFVHMQIEMTWKRLTSIEQKIH